MHGMISTKKEGIRKRPKTKAFLYYHTSLNLHYAKYITTKRKAENLVTQAPPLRPLALAAYGRKYPIGIP